LQVAPGALPVPATPLPLMIGIPTLRQLLVAVPPVPAPPVSSSLWWCSPPQPSWHPPASAVPPTNVMEPAVASASTAAVINDLRMCVSSCVSRGRRCPRFVIRHSYSTTVYSYALIHIRARCIYRLPGT